MAIRVICQAEPFMQTDFATTNHILNLFANFSQSYKASAPGINDLVQLLAKEEQEILFQLSESHPFSATLLPIHTVGVQCSSQSQYTGPRHSNPQDFFFLLYFRGMVGLIVMWLLSRPVILKSAGRTSLQWLKSYHAFATTSTG